MVIDTNSLLTVLLIFLRVFSFVFMVPFFGTFFMPNFVRVYLSFGIALSIFYFADVKPVEISSFLTFTSLALQEVLFGFVSGFFLRLLFDAVFVAGEVIAVNTGHGPRRFSTLVASTLFLSLGGAEAVYIGLAKSIEGFPLGTFDIYSLNGKVLLELFYRSFSMGG